MYFLNIIPDKNILIIEDKDFIKFIISSMKVLYKIRKEKIDTCIDMEFFSRASAIFSYLSGCKNRVGLHRFNAEQPFRGDLMTHKVNHNPHIHISQYYRMLVDVVFEDKLAHERPHNKLEIIDKEKIQLPSYTPDESLIQNIKKIIYDEFKEDIFSIKDKKLVLLNPNAGDLLPIRKWDSENYIELAYRLLNYDKNIYILLTGAPSERDAVEAMRFKINHSRVGSMAGKTSFKDLITLYYVSDLLVTNDSGPGHFTTLTSTRTIVLFGPETPLLFGSLSKNVRTIWKNLGCSPCVNVYNHRFSPCNNSICMKSITIDEVFH
ncbi:MAG: glycosyltransferase family 9 protein, partial [Bacteroidetes bacterium]